MKRASIAIAAIAAVTTIGAVAQVENGGVVRKRDANERKAAEQAAGVVISDRMQSFYENKEPHDADLAYTRTIYRQIDLSKDANTPLYFPEDVIDGKQNLFRVMLNLVVAGELPAYEYLDGREMFTDQYRVKVEDMLDRFDIYYNTTGSEGNRKIEIEEADVPTTQVLNYYIIERWDFDRRTNQMKTRVEAICPVLNRYGDFGGESKYPMFWVKFDALRPYLAQQYIFLSDDNNLEQYSLDDYFNLGMYEGDIYKTKNLRNQSLVQQFPNDDDLKHAQDSIDNRLRSFGKNLWVPDRDEYLAQLAYEAEVERARLEGDTIPERDTYIEMMKESNSHNKKAPAAVKKRTSKRGESNASKTSTKASNKNANKSVRRRKK